MTYFKRWTAAELFFSVWEEEAASEQFYLLIWVLCFILLHLGMSRFAGTKHDAQILFIIEQFDPILSPGFHTQTPISVVIRMPFSCPGQPVWVSTNVCFPDSYHVYAIMQPTHLVVSCLGRTVWVTFIKIRGYMIAVSVRPLTPGRPRFSYKLWKTVGLICVTRTFTFIQAKQEKYIIVSHHVCAP